MKTTVVLMITLVIVFTVFSCTQKHVRASSVRKAELFIPGCG
jgi:hypothetical protein